MDSIRNSVAWHTISNLDFEEGCVRLTGLKLSVIIANPLQCTEVREVYQILKNQTLVFRT